MPRRLLAIGECMVELSPHGEDMCAIGFAGDTFNTAFYARKAAPESALQVGYLSAVGSDALSQRMAEFMDMQGIVPELTFIPEATVGLYMIFLRAGERSFQYWRSQSAARRLSEDLSAVEGLRAGDFAYFSGITLAILPPDGREVLLETLKAAGGRGVRVVFDPNLRPSLWETPDAMRRTVLAGAAISEIVLPSFDDEVEWFGDVDKDATASRYLEAGARLVVVKDGPGSVLIRDGLGSGPSWTPEPVKKIVDTTAAGDAFNGGVLAALAQGRTIGDAVKLGGTIAGQVVGKRGALVPVTLVSEQNAVSASDF